MTPESEVDRIMLSGNKRIANTCSECDGAGDLDCLDCEGSGMDEDGDTCDLCSGDGSMECDTCNGTGREE